MSGDAIVWNGTQWIATEHGRLFLSELKDVTVNSVGDGEVIKYNATTGKWENGQALSDSDQTFVNELNAAVNPNGTDIEFIGNIYFNNEFDTIADLPSAVTYNGMFATVDSSGSAYFLHNGLWNQLVAFDNGSVDLESSTASMVFKKTGATNEFGIQANNDAIWMGRHSSNGDINQSIVIDDEGNVGIGVFGTIVETLDIDGQCCYF